MKVWILIFTMGSDISDNGAIEIIEGFKTEMQCNLSKNMITAQYKNMKPFSMRCVAIIKGK